MYLAQEDKSARGVIQETRLMHLLKLERMQDALHFDFYMRGKDNVNGALGRAE